MKNKLSILMALLCLPFFLLSQACLPEGITFETQEDIDNFSTNYPGCTHVYGDITTTGSGITNLDGLSHIDSVGGELFIFDCFDLTDVSGFDELKYIGGKFRLQETALDTFVLPVALKEVNGLEIVFNDSLLHLVVEDSLITINDDLIISQNPNLSKVIGFDFLDTIRGGYYITLVDQLDSISSFNQLKYVGSGFNLRNHQIAQMPTFEKLNYVGGEFILSGSDLTQEVPLFDALQYVGGSFIINFLEITYLNSFQNLLYIGKDLKIEDEISLVQWEAFPQLREVGRDLRISWNESLEEITGFDSLKLIGNDLSLEILPSLHTLNAFHNVDTIGQSFSFT